MYKRVKKKARKTPPEYNNVLTYRSEEEEQHQKLQPQQSPKINHEPEDMTLEEYRLWGLTAWRDLQEQTRGVDWVKNWVTATLTLHHHHKWMKKIQSEQDDQGEYGVCDPDEEYQKTQLDHEEDEKRPLKKRRLRRHQ